MPDPFASGGPMLLAGTANRPLAQEIARYLDYPLGEVTIKKFSDGEIFVRIDENVRGRDLFIIQSTTAPGDNIIELLLLIDAARRASAARIHAVVPYFGYARQDRKDQPRVAIGAKLMANMIHSAGADRLLSVDFHQHQIQGFFDIPVDHLYASPVFTRYFREKRLTNLVVISPDVGSAKMARGFAKRLDATMGIIDKRRPQANVAEVMNVIGEVEGKDCLLSDDMIDTAGTMAEAAHALKALGAQDIYACATHALLSGPAVERLSKAPFKEIVVTDTVPVPQEKRFPGLTVISVGELLGRAIRYTHSNESVSSLFE
ncbi:MAG TPA: ribose-phosphate pyrophosphokinase [Longimicrobium sp.]|jgi:ribose-phosphate pyrophosphokinase|uniref:ribose-phosphate diphosphokinase n=1 Tax=Longimicrobium sp. TaxID=2029185 RepID=UPI002ED9371D